MSAPPMPAKEVEPEFGFRDASPAVAAAALAALREGKEPPRGSTRGGRGRSRRPEGAPAPADAPVAAAIPSGNGDHAESEETRRRRRRRGGRGRGRGGRRDEGEAPAVSAPQPGEIGWTEVDDISQIESVENVGPLTDDAGEEREYTFEEADAATLAELGLLDGGVGAVPAPITEAEPTAAEPAGENTTPRRRTRTRKPAAEAPAGGEPEAAKTFRALADEEGNG